MSELVSILIPAYNAERWLGATIQSALAQTWPRKEIIVVDDGSRDRTFEVAKRFASSSVRVVTQPNGGAVAARNHALALAQGDWIQWLDADDLLDPEKISTQMRVAQQVADRRVLLSCAFGTFYFRTEKAQFVETSLWRDLTPVDYFLTRFEDNACFQTDAWLVSRELTEAAGPWTDTHSPDDDGEYFCRVVLQANQVKFVREARSYYRVGDYGSLNNARSHRAITALFGSKQKCVRYLLSLENSPRARAACLNMLQVWFPYFYPDHPDVVAAAQRLAGELGGELLKPTLKWKYRPIERLFGYERAMQASYYLPRFRSQVERKWDECLYRLSRPATVVANDSVGLQ
jgi:glycosyltransferase involved in cell wall biosynthesis